MIIAIAVVVLVRVLIPRKVELLDIVHAHRALSLGFRLAERGQEHAGENGDDCDDYEKLDQREGSARRGASKSAHGRSVILFAGGPKPNTILVALADISTRSF